MHQLKHHRSRIDSLQQVCVNSSQIRVLVDGDKLYGDISGERKDFPVETGSPGAKVDLIHLSVSLNSICCYISHHPEPRTRTV